MKKETIQLIVIGLGLLVLPAIIINNMKRAPKKPAVSAAPPVQPPQPAAVQQGGQGGGQTPAAINEQLERAKLAWGRDPFFLPAQKKEESRREMKLQGISRRQGTGYAMINGEIVRNGDRLGEYEIVDVERDQVLIRKGEQTYYLTFTEP